MTRARMARREVVKALLADRGDIVVIAGLGACAWDVTAAGDSPLNFPMWGGMGGAAMLGLGLALAQPGRIILVITGDGDMLMGLGSLATIAVQRPPNLRLVIIDNEHYGETGGQPTHTAAGVNLAAVAAGCGFPDVRHVTTADQLPGLRQAIQTNNQLLFAVVKVALTDDPFVLPPRDGVHLKNRLRAALTEG